MKHRNLILTTLLAGILTTAGFATISQAGPFCGEHHGAHAERMGYGEGRHDPMQRLLRHVDLSDAQQAEIKTLIETSREETKTARKELRDTRKTLRDLVAGDAYNIESVRNLADQQARLQADLTVARIDTMHRALQVLTPEQQAEMVKLREQRMEKRKAWKDEHNDN